MFRYMIFMVFFILSGCSDDPVTIEHIRESEREFNSAINQAAGASTIALGAVTQSYEELKSILRKDSLSDRELVRLEGLLENIIIKRNILSESIKEKDVKGDYLISLLKSRASENSDKEMRGILKEKIRIRDELFNVSLKNAKSQLKELDSAIKKFDNVVGYLQVSAGLKGVDVIIGQIDGIKEDITRLRNLAETYSLESRKLLQL